MGDASDSRMILTMLLDTCKQVKTPGLSRTMSSAEKLLNCKEGTMTPILVDPQAQESLLRLSERTVRLLAMFAAIVVRGRLHLHLPERDLAQIRSPWEWNIFLAVSGDFGSGVPLDERRNTDKAVVTFPSSIRDEASQIYLDFTNATTDEERKAVLLRKVRLEEVAMAHLWQTLAPSGDSATNNHGSPSE